MSESGIFAGNWKFLPEIGKFGQKLENSRRKLDLFLKYAFFFFARNCWVWPDLAKSHQIQPDLVEISLDLVEISPDLACFCRIWSDFFQLRSVRVARVLEMRTRHSTRRCRFLRTETRRRPTGPSVRAKIGLSSGGLAGLSGFGWAWTALKPVHFQVLFVLPSTSRRSNLIIFILQVVNI